ncbi:MULTISPECIES: hypothetical protein [unclassified Rhodococcus (in: high G+C Gram-positive bacteria)]|uniref:hypothetical protein n=1 Tax=unclassified Rhodococcus (in: high G+C Gram-positive bacteria) TaxID=192944 RepID=UPI00211B21B3|nr:MULTISPECIES: hypothetical protein [unclassified Rhodococcus (in: high G+C Gram-positive bacteria)]
MPTARCSWFIRGIISSPGTTGAIPSHIATVAVASASIRVRELSRSIDFYRSVFEFTVSYPSPLQLPRSVIAHRFR